MGEFDGITIEGKKSVEDFLVSEKDKEIGKAIEDEYYLHHYSKPHLKYRPRKERNGKVNHYSQAQVNAENFDNFIQQATKPREVLVAYLLAGKSFTVANLAELENDYKQKTIQSAIHRLYGKSLLGQHIIRTRKRDGKQSCYLYSLEPNAQNLTWENAIELSLQLKPVPRKELTEKEKRDLESQPQPDIDNEKLEREFSKPEPEEYFEEESRSLHIPKSVSAISIWIDMGDEGTLIEFDLKF